MSNYYTIHKGTHPKNIQCETQNGVKVKPISVYVGQSQQPGFPVPGFFTLYWEKVFHGYLRNIDGLRLE